MPNESRNRKEIRSHHTVLPDVETLLSVQTVPNAVCSFFLRGTDFRPTNLSSGGSK